MFLWLWSRTGISSDGEIVSQSPASPSLCDLLLAGEMGVLADILPNLVPRRARE